MKKRKGPFLTFTIGITLLSPLTPVFAQDTNNSGSQTSSSASSATSAQVQELSQQQALDRINSLFKLDDSYKLLRASRTDRSSSVQLSPINFPTVTWDFSWRKGDQQTGTTFNVTLDAVNGTVVNVNEYSQNQPESDSGTISEKQAKQIALDWISKLAPDKLTKLNAGDLTPFYSQQLNESFSFYFSRVVNGIPFRNNGISVQITASGELQSYNCSWSSIDDSAFPSAAPTVSLDQAEKTFANLPLSLEYLKSFQHFPNQSNVRLIYVPGNTGSYGGLPVVDAGNDTLLSLNPAQPVSSTVYGAVYQTAPLAQAPGAPLITSPLTSKDDAVALAKKLVNLDGSYVLTSSTYGTEPPYTMTDSNSVSSVNVWSLSFMKQLNSDDKNFMAPQIQVTLNASTGEIMRMYNNGSQASAQNPNGSQLTWDQAVDKAIAFVTRAFPTKLNQLTVNRQQRSYMSGGGITSFGITFNTLVNGIPVQGPNQLSVNVNSASGDISQVYVWTDNVDSSSYPDPAKAVSIDAAQAAFVKQYPLQLSYVLQPTLDTSTGRYSWSNPPRLVYAPYSQTAMSFDAIAGQFVSTFPNQLNHVDLTDIQNHWAKKQLQSFADRGLLEVKDGKVNPDQSVTRAKVLHLFVTLLQGLSHSGFNGGYGYASSYSSGTDEFSRDLETAKSLGWIEKNAQNLRPDDKLTREEVADLTARVLGYTKLASDVSLFHIRFIDVSELDPMAGDIAIVSSLGIMKGDAAGIFRPNAEVSLAELVVVLDRISRSQQSGPFFR